MAKRPVNVGDTEGTRRIANTLDRQSPKLKKGDLVCAYIMNSSLVEKYLQHGVVIEVNTVTDDVMVLDNNGYTRWYPESRWRICDKES